MASSSQYFRVKRNAQIIFINSAAPTKDTILTLKQRIVHALGATKNTDPAILAIKSPSDIQLLAVVQSNTGGGSTQSRRDGSASSGAANNATTGPWLELLDNKTLAASGLKDQQVIAMTLRTSSGGWEEVSIAQPEALADLDDLEDEPEEYEYSRSYKGKELA